MKKSTKAALLSGLVFPGIGHLYLKRYVPGILLSVGSAAAIYYIFSAIMDTALTVAEKIQSGAVSPDVAAITDLLSQQPGGSEQSANVATLVLMVFWLVGIVDSYRKGRE